MTITKTPIEGLIILEPNIFTDTRGYFFESYNRNTFETETGVNITFIQDNQAGSSKNVLRGLHYQNAPRAQTKLIRTLEGAIWDVAVDIRKDSPTFGQWFGIELTAQNNKQFLIPHGFAHGYSVLSDYAVVAYKCDDVYDKESEGGIHFAEPSFNIDWKIDINAAIISEKDKNQPALKDAVILF